MKKTILVLAANPKNMRKLRLDEEMRNIQNSFRNSEAFKVELCLAPRQEDVRRAMLEYDPFIVHFCGHGEGENGLAFEEDSGNSLLVDGEVLAEFFKLFSDKVDCVVLNACYSEIQAEAIAKHINFVIGMKNSILDKSALEFAFAFYDAIRAKKTFKHAFDIAYNAVKWKIKNPNDFPVLKTKPGLITSNEGQILKKTSLKSKAASNKIEIIFDRDEDFQGGLEGTHTIAYKLIKMQETFKNPITFELSFEVVIIAAQKIKSLENLPWRNTEQEIEYLHLMKVKDGVEERGKLLTASLDLALNNNLFLKNSGLSHERYLADFLRGLRDVIFGAGTPLLPGQVSPEWFEQLQKDRPRAQDWFIWWRGNRTIQEILRGPIYYTVIDVTAEEVAFVQELCRGRPDRCNPFLGRIALPIFELTTDFFYYGVLPKIAILIVKKWPGNNAPSEMLDFRNWVFSKYPPEKVTDFDN